MTIIDRLRGTLVGLAVGDALGAAVEFKTPGSFEPVTCYRDGGPHRLAPGEWTDDTSMALALADSMVETGWDLDHQAECYLAWRDEGQYSVNGRCFDIGITVGGALRRYRETGDARTAASSDEQSSGNGSIMRLAPVPIRFAYLFPSDIEQLATLAEQSSLPTHASPQCLSACRYMAAILAAFAHGRPREEVLSSDWDVLRELEARTPLHSAVKEIANGSYRERQPPEIRGSGYVVHTLEAALWAFHKASTFEEAVLRVVNLGEDADTTGAVCGQIAGAYWGESGIPKSLRNGLAKPEMIEEALCGLLGLERPKVVEETDQERYYLRDEAESEAAVEAEVDVEAESASVVESVVEAVVEAAVEAAVEVEVESEAEVEVEAESDIVDAPTLFDESHFESNPAELADSVEAAEPVEPVEPVEATESIDAPTLYDPPQEEDDMEVKPSVLEKPATSQRTLF